MMIRHAPSSPPIAVPPEFAADPAPNLAAAPANQAQIIPKNIPAPAPAAPPYGYVPTPPPPHEDAHLSRLWWPRHRGHRASWHRLGIGVVTYNRRRSLERCLAALEEFTVTPFSLVVADDGSQDGTSSWLRESGVPVVTGRNRGVAWNKNRALYHLLNHTQAQVLLLLEDDVLPCERGWEIPWIEAALQHGHVNYCSPFIAQHFMVEGGNTPSNPFVSLHISAQVTIETREAASQLGYYDPRLHTWGLEHIERTRRYTRLKYGLDRTPSADELATAEAHWKSGGDPFSLPNVAPMHSLCMGVHMIDAAESGEASTFADMDALRANEARALTMLKDPIWRHPWRNRIQHAAFLREQARARWPFDESEGEPMVSVLCATRSAKRAEKLAASIAANAIDVPYEIVWAWNQPAAIMFVDCPLPGRHITYHGEEFQYEEAINAAASVARGRVFLIVNDDVELQTYGLFGRLLELGGDPRVGAIYGGDHRMGYGSELPFADLRHAEAAPEAPGIAGCCWAITRRAFHAMGGLEESLTEYGGDEAVATLRLKRLGFEGRLLHGWKYGHNLHTSYGEGAWNTRHGAQVATALGYTGFPVQPDRALFGALWHCLFEREGIDFQRAHGRF